MWIGTKLILAVVLVSTFYAIPDPPSAPLCDVSNLDPVNVPKILNGTLFRALSTEVWYTSSGYVLRYEQKTQDPSTLIIKRRKYYVYHTKSITCDSVFEFDVNITEHGFGKKRYEMLIIAYSDNHIALMFAKKNWKHRHLYILARNFTRPLKMTDIDSAMLHKIGQRCGKNTTRLDFYIQRYEPLPTTGNNCSVF